MPIVLGKIFLLAEASFPWYFYPVYSHPIITKKIGKEDKKKWRGDLTETIGAYE